MGKPAKSPWLAPHITVKDIRESMAFYENAFKFTTGIMMDDDDGRLCHVEMSYQGQPVIMMGREGADMMASACPASMNVESPFNIYVYCEDLDNSLMIALNSGAKLLREPEETIWGDRAALVKCINGYIFVLASNMLDDIFDEPLF